MVVGLGLSALNSVYFIWILHHFLKLERAIVERILANHEVDRKTGPFCCHAVQHVVGFVFNFQILSLSELFVAAHVCVFLRLAFGLLLEAHFSVGLNGFVLLAYPLLLLVVFLDVWLCNILLVIFVLELVFKLLLFFVNRRLLDFHLVNLFPIFFVVCWLHLFDETILTLTLQGSLKLSDLLCAISMHVVDAKY